MEKNKSSVGELMKFAGNHRFFVYASWFLSGVSAVLAMAPFYFIWRLIREVLASRPDFASAAGSLKFYGWAAVVSALLALLVYVGGLMCSHKAAFRIQSNLRLTLMNHIMTLPLGLIEKEGSGKIRRIVNDSSAATETFIAHSLPDKVVSCVTPICLVAMMLFFDWKIGLLCLVPALLAFLAMGGMMGKKMQQDMAKYQDSLETMSNEAVEYDRGIPVVKTFGQSVFSFNRFKAAIDGYEKWTVAYTKSMMKPMVSVHACDEFRFCVFDCGGLHFGRKRRFGLADFESSLLYNSYSDSDDDADENRLFGRGFDDCDGRSEPHERDSFDEAAC